MNFGLFINRLLNGGIDGLIRALPIQWKKATEHIAVKIILTPLALPFEFVWYIVFFVPLMMFSIAWEKATGLRPFVFLFGTPQAMGAYIIARYAPFMAGPRARMTRLIYIRTFPYSWRFRKYKRNKQALFANDELHTIFQTISKDAEIKEYLDALQANIVSEKNPNQKTLA